VKNYLLVRAVESVVAVWGVLTIVFFALRLSGDPAVLMLPVGSTEQQVNEFRHAMGFDRPLPIQYIDFLRRAVTGDFSDSLRFQQPALPLVLERMPATGQLALTALAIAIVFGGLAGFLAATRRGSIFELFAMSGALLGQAMPSFWLGIMLILVFGVVLHWFPTSGQRGPESLVLPAVTLATYSSASIARLFRSSLLEVLGRDYVRTGWAKGLGARQVYLRHAFRNALIPVITMVGLQTGLLLGGSVITETIFSWPGAGRLIVQAIYNKDFPLVQAGVCVLAVMFVTVNFAVDALYAYTDPRIRLGR
jgi:peptide/nickel transport system permease protein